MNELVMVIPESMLNYPFISHLGRVPVELESKHACGCTAHGQKTQGAFGVGTDD
jgi:hypothetical protein